MRESIVDPNANIAPGYQPSVMPGTFESSLSDEQLDALVQYLVEGPTVTDVVETHHAPDHHAGTAAPRAWST